MKQQAAQKIKQVIDKTKVFEGRGQNDTVRLWENYREQAMLWRALALFQMPSTFLLIIFSVLLWATRTITLEVPAKPLPGSYIAKEIPDTEFVEQATEFINLIATYQPSVARRQFDLARGLVREPMLDRFDKEMMNIELKAIEGTDRTQVYFIDPTLTALERNGDNQARVTFVGDRLKIVAGKELPMIKTKFSVTMTTVPRHRLNPYGIVVVDLTFENIER